MARVHQEQALQQMRAQLRAREEAEEERDHDQVIWYMYICTMCTCLGLLWPPTCALTPTSSPSHEPQLIACCLAHHFPVLKVHRNKAYT